MLCPVCLHRARVIDTRHPRRRYICTSCDIRWSTLETITPSTLRASRPRPLPRKKKKTGNWLANIQAALAE